MATLNLRMKHDMDKIRISFPQKRPRRAGEEAWELSPLNIFDISLHNDSITLTDHQVELLKKRKRVCRGTS